MALSAKEISSLIKELNEYGATLYYMLEQGKISIDDIENVLFKDTIEQVNLVFPTLINKIGLREIEQADEKYHKDFTKFDCIDRIILIDGNKHQHLKEIRNLVNLDKRIDNMIKDKTYNQAFNLNYTEKILKLLEKNVKKSYLSIRERLKLYQTAFQLLRDDNDKKLSSNIDNYYIASITS